MDLDIKHVGEIIGISEAFLFKATVNPPSHQTKTKVFTYEIFIDDVSKL
jgi:hypothetical protein